MYRQILFPKPQNFSIRVYLYRYTLDLSINLRAFFKELAQTGGQVSFFIRIKKRKTGWDHRIAQRPSEGHQPQARGQGCPEGLPEHHRTGWNKYTLIIPSHSHPKSKQKYPLWEQKSWFLVGPCLSELFKGGPQIYSSIIWGFWVKFWKISNFI